MSFMPAVVVMFSENENRAVKAAMAPIRPGMLCIMYRAVMPTIGRRQATRVIRVFRTLKVPSSR